MCHVVMSLVTVRYTAWPVVALDVTLVPAESRQFIVSLHGHSATLKSTTSGSSLEPASGQVGYREIAKTLTALCFVESDLS